MTRTVTLTLDEETAEYLDRIAADQGRTPAEVAAWIVTEDLRHERAIDAELAVRVDSVLDDLDALDSPTKRTDEAASRTS
jgi:hypothetical protein